MQLSKWREGKAGLDLGRGGVGQTENEAKNWRQEEKRDENDRTGGGKVEWKNT